MLNTNNKKGTEDSEASAEEVTPLASSCRARFKGSTRERTGTSSVIPGTKAAHDLVASDRQTELRTLSVLLVSAFLWLSVGVVYMMAFEDFEFVEALYISVQLITTVGYGDFIVTPSMEMFMSMYLLGCIIWVGFALSNFVEALQEMSSEFLRLKLRVAEKRMGWSENEDQAAYLFGRFNDLVASTFFFFLMLAIGTVSMKLMEHCSCMDAVNQPIPDCRVGHSCGTTGGRVLTWTSSFYLSVVTLTTCGFGDLHPGTKKGMAFACVWIVVGVTSTANFIRAFCAYFFVFWKKHYVITDKVVGKVFEEIDAMDEEADGEISRNDYRIYLIKRFGLVDPSVLESIDRQFDLFDQNRDGIVSYKTMERIYLDEGEDLSPKSSRGRLASNSSK